MVNLHFFTETKFLQAITQLKLLVEIIPLKSESFYKFKISQITYFYRLNLNNEQSKTLYRYNSSSLH